MKFSWAEFSSKIAKNLHNVQLLVKGWQI